MSDYDYDYNYFYDFESYSNETRVVLHWLYDATGNVANAKKYPEFIISLIGIFLNIFHLIILTRESMRSTSINVLLIGIAICDLFFLAHSACCFMYLHMNPELECVAPWSYFRAMADVVLHAMKDSFRRVSALLGVLMAATRFLIIKTSLNPKYQYLQKPSFSWTIILFSMLLNTLFSLADRSRMQINEQEWAPPDHCTGFPENFTAKLYFVFIQVEEHEMCLEQIVLITEGMMKIIPAILLPILALLLLRELKTAAKNRRKLTASQRAEAPQKDHTTKLVILMTVSFMIAEAPLGFVYMTQSFITMMPVPMMICNNFYTIFSTFVVLNATTHCVLCMTMSSQYRTCARSLFCRKSKSKTVMVSSKASVSSVASVRNVVVTI